MSDKEIKRGAAGHVSLWCEYVPAAWQQISNPSIIIIKTGLHVQWSMVTNAESSFGNYPGAIHVRKHFGNT